VGLLESSSSPPPHMAGRPFAPIRSLPPLQTRDVHLTVVQSVVQLYPSLPERLPGSFCPPIPPWMHLVVTQSRIMLAYCNVFGPVSEIKNATFYDGAMASSSADIGKLGQIIERPARLSSDAASTATVSHPQQGPFCFASESLLFPDQQAFSYKRKKIGNFPS